MTSARELARSRRRQAAFQKMDAVPDDTLGRCANADYREGSDRRIPAITARSTSCARELASSFPFAASTWACTVLDDRPRIMAICGSVRPAATHLRHSVFRWVSGGGSARMGRSARPARA
jgi:hypothetical protein